jgi:ribonuclease MRP protein subunit RMP1
MAGVNHDIETLSRVLTQLGTPVTILDGFNHRNKNQHRLSRWWAEFGMVRRGTRKLLEDLQVSIQKRPTPRFSDKQSSKSPEHNVGIQEEISARARHLRQQIVPRAYL